MLQRTLSARVARAVLFVGTAFLAYFTLALPAPWAAAANGQGDVSVTAGSNETIPINLNDLMMNRDPALNLPVNPGDVISVPIDRPVSIFVDGAVKTPGRLEDLIQRGDCALDRVEISVLDEADFLADLGFLPAVTRLGLTLVAVGALL